MSETESPLLSIILVNWNSVDYLHECLKTVYATSAGVGFEVIVVDNASARDETIAIKAAFPEVIAIRSATNLGFAGANNLGSRYASGRYYLFLNPDTEVIDSAISSMLASSLKLPTAGILGCKLLNSDGSIQTSCIQRFPTITNQLLDLEFLRSRWPHWNIWGIAPLLSERPDPVEVEVVSGACLLMRSDVFEAVGGFSEKYFMYAEDVDLCYRVRKRGWRAYYTGNAVVSHHGGGTSKSRRSNGWVAVMQRQAISTFCQTAHGPLYSACYRITVGISAALRIGVLTLMYPVQLLSSGSSLAHNTLGKWTSVLKWAVGLNGTTSNT